MLRAWCVAGLALVWCVCWVGCARQDAPPAVASAAMRAAAPPATAATAPVTQPSAPAAARPAARSKAPEVGPDAIVLVRPQLKAELDALPPATIEALPLLINDLIKWQRRQQLAPPPPPLPGYVQTADASNPLDPQVIAGEVGRRIEDVLAHAQPDDVERALTAAAREATAKLCYRQMAGNISYAAYRVRSANGRGQQPIYYFEQPDQRLVTLPGKAEAAR